MNSKLTLVSIIIPNYDGRIFLPVCLSAISELNFPRSKLEVIIVDNNSTDNSVDFVKKNYPWVYIIESSVNLGFAGGCDLGIKRAKGKYIVLLNTDTKVTKNWLTYLVKRIETDKNIVAVNSKILLFFPFIELLIRSDVHMRSEFTRAANFQSVGILVENIVLDNSSLQNLIVYRKGFYETEQGNIITRWTKGDASVLIPIDPRRDSLNVTFTLRAGKLNSKLKTQVKIKLKNTELVAVTLESYEVKQYTISLKTSDLENHYQYTVQNCGIVLFRNGQGRDRGCVVKNHEQFSEIDNDFYNKSTQIDAFCGASVIIKKDCYEKAGGFDQSFFLYYEDVDLSLRLRSKGWKIVYEPKSIVYHIHAGSSIEGSGVFVYNTEKNHLMFVLKQLPLKVFLSEVCMYVLLWVFTLLRTIKWWVKEEWGAYELLKERLEVRSNVLKWILTHLIYGLKSRWSIGKRERKRLNKIYEGLY